VAEATENPCDWLEGKEMMGTNRLAPLVLLLAVVTSPACLMADEFDEFIDVDANYEEQLGKTHTFKTWQDGAGVGPIKSGVGRIKSDEAKAIRGYLATFTVGTKKGSGKRLGSTNMFSRTNLNYIMPIALGRKVSKEWPQDEATKTTITFRIFTRNVVKRGRYYVAKITSIEKGW
jgi:hypothetical protein